MEEKAIEEKEETYNEADLLCLLDEFMGRRADLGGDTVMLDSQQTIAAVGLFFVEVGWVLRLDQNRYIHLPAEMDLVGRSARAELGCNSANGTKTYKQRQGRRSRRPRKRRNQFAGRQSPRKR